MLRKVRELFAKVFRIADEVGKYEVALVVAHDDDAENPAAGFRSKITTKDSGGEVRVLFQDVDPDDIDAVLKLVADAVSLLRSERAEMRKRVMEAEA